MQAELEVLLIEQVKPNILKSAGNYANSEAVYQTLLSNVVGPVSDRVDSLLAYDGKLTSIKSKSFVLIQKVIEDYLGEIGISLKKIGIDLDRKIDFKATTSIHKEYPKVLEFVKNAVPVLMVGPAGCGKNIIAVHVAKELGLTLYRINSPQDKFEFEGFIDGKGQYHETEFYHAFVNGGLLLLDEMDNAMAGALIAINDAIANGRFTFPSGEVVMNPNFRVIASANTWGNGRDAEYVGRNKLDASTLDRFATWSVDYDRNLELEVFQNPEILEFVWALRDAVKKSKSRVIFSTRSIKYFCLLDSVGYDPQKTLQAVITKGISVTDLRKIRGSMKRSANKYVHIFNELVDSM